MYRDCNINLLFFMSKNMIVLDVFGERFLMGKNFHNLKIEKFTRINFREFSSGQADILRPHSCMVAYNTQIDGSATKFQCDAQPR